MSSKKDTPEQIPPEEPSPVQETPGGIGRRPPPLEPGPLPGPLPEAPFPSPAADLAYGALKGFVQERPCAAELRWATGLPTCLYGSLQDPQGGSYLEAAQVFLGSHELMLTTPGTRLVAVGEMDWPDGLHQVTFSQTNRDGVPLYGSNVVCGFADGQLTLLTSTAYPAPPEVIDELLWGDPPQAYDQQPLQSNLPSQVEFGPLRFEAPPHLRPESRERGWKADRWILPYRPEKDGEGEYRPVWRAIVVEEDERRWLKLIDANTGETLFARPAWVSGDVAAHAYLTDEKALSGNLDPVQLHYGAGTNLDTAERVHVTGDRRAEPPGNTTEQILTANTFYHTYESQQKFAGLLSTAFPSSGNPFPGTDPTQDIHVDLADETGSGLYYFDTNTIWMGKGTVNVPEVHEPGFDCELIYHEFTHAVNHNLKPEVFQFSDDDFSELFSRGLDEGLAFYFACAFGGNPQWAQSAYQHADWQACRNLENAPNLLSTALGKMGQDPADIYHALGVWWAGMFWALSGDGQLAGRWRELLLQGFKELSGPIDRPQTFGLALLQHAANSQEQAIIVAAFAGHGATLPVV